MARQLSDGGATYDRMTGEDAVAMQPGHDADATLTRIEWVGLRATHNLADGHARQGPVAGIDMVVSRLPDLYRYAEVAGQVEVQQGYERMLFRAAGCESVLDRVQPPLHHYSSSISIEVVANYLRLRGLSVGLLHPTFDNIPDILRRHGVPLAPVDEAVLSDPSEDANWGDEDVLFLVVPNNPTGSEPSVAMLEAIARQCARRGVLLVIDFSFRFFSSRQLNEYDVYAMLEASGVSYIGIEDSGKLWPTLDMKVGTLVASEACWDELRAITDDVLLNVSPFIFAVLSAAPVDEIVAASRLLSATNQRRLASDLAGTPLEVVGGDRHMSVAWVRLPPGWEANSLVAWLEREGVVVLPGEPFYWADGDLGKRFVRVALLRPQDAFAKASAALSAAIALYPADLAAGSV